MAYICDNCSKGIQVGNNIRHKRGVAGGRWKRKAQKTPRRWLPNLHNARVVEGSKVVSKRLCTKCLRRAERPHQALGGNSRTADAAISKAGSSGGQAKQTKGKKESEDERSGKRAAVQAAS